MSTKTTALLVYFHMGFQCNSHYSLVKLMRIKIAPLKVSLMDMNSKLLGMIKYFYPSQHNWFHGSVIWLANPTLLGHLKSYVCHTHRSMAVAYTMNVILQLTQKLQVMEWCE